MATPLHEKIGSTLKSASLGECEIVLDAACGGKQHVPLFVHKPKSNATEYCKVDILLLQDRRVCGIIEIEESSIQPAQIFGKFLASALATYYQHERHRDVPIPMNNHTFFLQVVDSSRLKEGSSKPKQFQNVERSIRTVMPLPGSSITTYKLITVKGVDDSDQIAALVQWIKKTVSTPPD